MRWGDGGVSVVSTLSCPDSLIGLCNGRDMQQGGRCRCTTAAAGPTRIAQASHRTRSGKPAPVIFQDEHGKQCWFLWEPVTASWSSGPRRYNPSFCWRASWRYIGFPVTPAGKAVQTLGE